MTKFAPGTDLSGIDTMTGLPKGQSRTRSPRRGKSVKGPRPRPPMPSPKPPMRGPKPPIRDPRRGWGGTIGAIGGRPPVRDRMEEALQDRRRRDLLTGRKRPPSDKWGEGTLPPGYRRGPKDGLIKDPNYSRPPMGGGRRPPMFGGGRPKPPRRGRTVKGPRPRPPMSSPKPPRRGDLPPMTLFGGGIR